MPKKNPNANAAYQLKVVLLNCRPPIWRRLQVPGSIRLSRLHDVIQIAMGWEDYHLHEFYLGDMRWADPDPENDPEVQNERRARLCDILPAAKMNLHYLYDFGDGWEHRILVEKILPPQEGSPIAVCLAGRRACPPEDVGGPWGYSDYLAAIADPTNPRHEEMLEWRGDDFNPEVLNLAEINDFLQEVKF